MPSGCIARRSPPALTPEEGFAPERQRWTIAEGDSGQRLDVHLAAHIGQARNQAQRWIREQRVRVNGKVVRSSYVLGVGDRIATCPPLVVEDRPSPEAGVLHILYADDHVIAVDKAAGVVVHPGAGRESGTLVNHLLHRYPEIAAVGSPQRPGIDHRLDAGTTGVILVARTGEAYQVLSRAFQERRIFKQYLGIAYGSPDPAKGTMDRPIARHRIQRRKMTVSPSGRPAITHYEVLSPPKRGVALLSLVLETGRTHQIRVHLKSRGWPLIGDPLYGEARWRDLPTGWRSTLRAFCRPALHAWRIELEHPMHHQTLRISASPPEDMARLWRDLFQEEMPTSGKTAG